MESKVNLKLMAMAGQGGSVFGLALMGLIKERTDLMVLSSDMSTPAGLDKFKTAYPDHFMNLGIAEQNMIGTAAGLTDEGYKCVCVAQASFISMRCFEQIRQYCGYMQLPLIIVGIGSGFSLQYMGNTHFALEDMALMRTISGMQVIAPCDAYESTLAFEYAINCKQPVYLRLFGGTAVPAVFNAECAFLGGKATKLRDGQDVQVIATGSMVASAVKVADSLSLEGISTSVVDMHTVKPLDVEAIEYDKKLIVTLEEHSVIGGLGSAVAETISKNANHPRLLSLGVRDRYLPVGSYQYLLKQSGLDLDSIKKEIINNIM